MEVLGFALVHRGKIVERHQRVGVTEIEAVRFALNRPQEADSATLAALGAGQHLRRTGAGASATVLSRDRVTQAVTLSSRTNLSRSRALQAQANRFKVELHKKWALAFACMVFTLIGPPIALRFPRGGVGLVVVASTSIFAIYWMGLIGGEALADRRIADPMVSMWLTNAIFLAVGLVLVRRMGRAGGTVRGGLVDDLWAAVRSAVRVPARRRAPSTAA